VALVRTATRACSTFTAPGTFPAEHRSACQARTPLDPTTAGGRPDLLTPITAAPAYLKVEAWHSVVAEGALHPGDIFTRRMRIDRALAPRRAHYTREVAELVAPLLNWSAEDVDREVLTYVARVGAQLLSPTQSDDAAADALRISAPEARDEILGPVCLS
jgi:glycerol-3-phosphate dehydrogenase